PTDKPRVERAGGYSRASFFAGRTFPSLAIMRQEAARWCLELAGQRVHGTTGQKPLEAFLAHEQGALLPLPPKPWESIRWTTARVHADCHLHAGGTRSLLRSVSLRQSSTRRPPQPVDRRDLHRRRVDRH